MTKEEEANAQPSGVIRIDAPGNDRKPPSCCLCLDVRFGTVMIGLFNLICHAFWIVSISSYFARQKANEAALNEYSKQWQVFDKFHELAQQHQSNVNHHMVAMVIACLSFIIVIMLVYGAALRKSGYILPFFFLQVFDLCVSVLIAATMTSYAPQLKYHLEMTAPDAAHRECIQHMTLTHFRLVLFTFWLFVLGIKYYFASVVWDCYCHCKKIEERRVQTDSQAAILLYQGDMETMNLLPAYEEVIKTPPPAYVQ